MSVAIVAFSKGQLVVKSTAYNRLLSGRDIDYTLLQHFANSEAPLSVESVMNDVRTFSRLSRDAYEELIAPFLNRIALPIQQAPSIPVYPSI